jgi:hypothetical protein
MHQDDEIQYYSNINLIHLLQGFPTELVYCRRTKEIRTSEKII